MTSMYDKVVAVISKSPDERSTKTIQPLLPWFKKKSTEVFGSLQQGVYVLYLINNYMVIICYMFIIK